MEVCDEFHGPMVTRLWALKRKHTHTHMSLKLPFADINMFVLFPLSVLKGTYDCWTYVLNFFKRA